MPRIINNRKRIEVRKQLRKNQTPEEIILWSKLRNNQTNYKWKRQVSIGPYIADFYCPEKKLVIEIDVGIHRSKEQKEYDIGREVELERFDISVIRFTNDEVENDIELVRSKIESTCKSLCNVRK